MMYVNKRKRFVAIALIIFSSFFTSLMFQNCSGGIQSQADLSSLNSGSNTPSSVPNPGALPMGCSGNPPASIITQVSACPSGQTGTGTVSIVDYTCVGTTYQQLPPRQVTSCVSSTTPPPPALTTDEKANICDDYIAGVTPTLTNTKSAVTLTSGLGDGNRSPANGDARTEVITATVDAKIPATSQQIKPPYKYVTGQRSDPELNCQYTTNVTCEVIPNDPATNITQAFPKAVTSAYYGTNAAAAIKALTDTTKRDADWANLVGRIFAMGRSTDGSTCTFDFSNALQTRSQDYTLGSVRDDTGYMCVKGTLRVRMKARTTTPAGVTNSNDSAWSYYTVTVNEDCWDESKLIPNPAALPTKANYGNVVAASDRWIAVLSVSDNNGSTTQVGSVSVFDKNNLSLTPVKIYIPGLIGGGATSGGDMTVSAALAGNWLAISSFNRISFKGQVLFYVHENGSWVRKTTLTSQLSTDSAKYGYALALSTNGILAVGAPYYTNSTSGDDLSGRVYIYSCSAGGCNTKPVIEIANPNVGALFGAALSLSGNRLAVGAPYSTAESDSHGDGFVRVYDISGSTATQVGNTILPPGDDKVSTGPSDIQISNPVAPGGVKAGRGFGSSVAVNGTKLLVGAPNKSRLSGGTTLVAKVGEAYFYPNFTTYANSTSLNPAGVRILNVSGAGQDSRYGQGVAFNTNGAFTGCPYCQNNMGLIYYFPFSSGDISTTPTRTAFPNDRTPRDGFGNSIYATDSEIVVGASNRTVGSSTQAGAAYSFVAP